MSKARELVASGRTAEAVALLEDAVRKGPYDEGLDYALGELMTEHAPAAEMIRFFSSELEHDAKPQTSHYFWAIGLARSGDVDGAIAHLETALDIDPAHEMSQRLWGVLLERRGQLEAAYAHMIEATRIHPEFRAALQDAARVARRLGRNQEAASLEARARVADPNTPRCFVYWARYLHAKGRDAAALVEVDRRLLADPSDAEALTLRAAITSALNDSRIDGRNTKEAP
jgi:tetratricopeptide (TPR) repeat protein